MMDYLERLLEKVEEVLSEESKLSLLQEGELAGLPGPRREYIANKNTAKERKAAQEDAREAIQGDAWDETLGSTSGSLERGQPKTEGSASQTRETDLEPSLGRIWDRGEAGQWGMAGRDALGEGRSRRETPGTYLLEKMRREHRMADLGSGGGVLHATAYGQKEPGPSLPTPVDVAAFDRAVEREARGYDHGFSLL